MTLKPAVFIDRDNTLIHNDGDLGDPDLVKMIQGSPSAVASLNGLNYLVVVITNQGGVARGKYTEDDVDLVHERVSAIIQEQSGGVVDGYYYCPFHPKGTVAKYTMEHELRKPAPGMLLLAAEDLGIDLASSWMIGDAGRDVQAGKAAGVRTILIDPELTDEAVGDVEGLEGRPHFGARNMIEAVRIIAGEGRQAGKVDAGVKVKVAGAEGGGSDRYGEKLGRIEEHSKQILDEVRLYARLGQGGSGLTLIAVVLQLVAMCCLLGGLFLGGTVEGYIAWFGSGIMIQLSVIGVLLFGK